MKLRAVILKNFRGYFLETKIPVDDLTALIGKNDVGKSTILEALDIFSNQTKVEQGDRNVLHTGEETIIGCVFDDLPSVIALENVSTSLAGEYLLNSEGTLEVWKKYPTSGKQTIWIRAWHPANEGFDDHDEEMLKRIADTLGVFPDFAPALSSHHGIKLVVCVEGPNDVAFLTAISKIAHRADDSIIDLNASADIIVMPLGGSALKDWVNHNYLQKLGTPEYHIYDSDNTDAYIRACDKVNRRGDGSSARMTQKREMENYIHDQVVQELFHVQIHIDDTMDVSTEISRLIRAENPEGFSPETVKRKLNRLGAQKMTLELLQSRDPQGEVLGWLRQISEIVRA